jgi:diacylglycerol kinase family enzyme
MSPSKICVIYNPASGRGWSARRLEELRRAWAERAAFWPTAAPGQAEGLAVQAARSGFATVAAAGGDGTVHEVVNGLFHAQRPDIVLAVIPVGSANDYAASLGLDDRWWQHDDPAIGPHAVDVGIIRADGRCRYFIGSLGLGLLGRTAKESRRIRWLKGMFLYGLAALRTICFQYYLNLMTVRIDGKERTAPTLALTLELGRSEGNFVLAPEAELDDGMFDYIHAGSLRRLDFVRLLPRVLLGRGLPHDYPNLWLGRCRQVRIHAESPLVVHADGELFCIQADGVRDLEIDLLPRALRVLGKFPFFDSRREGGC